MFLARVLAGRSPQVYPLVGSLYFPRVWRFVSYQRGVAAIGENRTTAVKMARREFERPPVRRVA